MSVPMSNGDQPICTCTDASAPAVPAIWEVKLLAALLEKTTGQDPAADSALLIWGGGDLGILIGFGNEDNVSTLAWSPSGAHWASGGIGGTIQLWHIHSDPALCWIQAASRFCRGVRLRRMC